MNARWYRRSEAGDIERAPTGTIGEPRAPVLVAAQAIRRLAKRETTRVRPFNYTDGSFAGSKK